MLRHAQALFIIGLLKSETASSTKTRNCSIITDSFILKDQEISRVVCLFISLQGFVSDGNSYALGGISGHAGFSQLTGDIHIWCMVLFMPKSTRVTHTQPGT